MRLSECFKGSGFVFIYLFCGVKHEINTFSYFYIFYIFFLPTVPSTSPDHKCRKGKSTKKKKKKGGNFSQYKST